MKNPNHRQNTPLLEEDRTRADTDPAQAGYVKSFDLNEFLRNPSRWGMDLRLAERRKDVPVEDEACGTDLTQPVHGTFLGSTWQLWLTGIRRNWRTILLLLALSLLMLVGMVGAYVDLQLPE